MYRITGPLQLPTQYIILIVADFNFDQVLPKNVAKVDPLIQNLNLSQRSQYSTQTHGGLLKRNNDKNIIHFKDVGST